MARDKDSEVDLESGLVIEEDDLKKASTLDYAKQGTTLFAKFSGMFSGDCLKGDDMSILYCSESNSSEVSDVDVEETSKSLMGKDSVGCEMKTPVKEKRKKASNKKAPKPPRPPRSPSLDAADQKLIREITELTMLKRARIERMKAMRKAKSVRSSSSLSSSSSSSSNSSMISLVFTIMFCIVLFFQGMSSGTTSEVSFQGSPVSAGGIDGGMNAVRSHLNPSASVSNAPGSESHM
ncbi:uncharacterized protein G2W53_038965 [Senna tora]|uniref:Transmembrane protein n=1 Tax=Senna tora TaxID=362788 RepID=A0A834T0L8_9FABA|nr:uncharacterized protein G2W53_038965 [Senna tora]